MTAKAGAIGGNVVLHLDEVFTGVETRGRLHLPLAGNGLLNVSHADDLRQNAAKTNVAVRSLQELR